MQKTITKAIGFFTLVLFVMSVTGAAATCIPAKAYSDTFDFSPSKYSGNVLSNDKGTSIRVSSSSQCTNGGKVTMNSNGVFSYKPASSSKTTIKDTFTYKIVNKCGQYSSAQVTINYKKDPGSNTGSIGTVVEVSRVDQINAALKRGPVFLSFISTTCPHCRALAPTLKQLAKEYAGKVTVMTVDIKKNPQLVKNFKVGGVPDSNVFVGIEKGQYVYMQQDGKKSTSRYKARIMDDQKISVYEKVLNYALRK